jgi:predicted ATPase
MKEKLIIQNFGPIKSVELELGKITVLIGEQATGKSTIAKVLSVCRYFSYLVTAVSTKSALDNFNTPFEDGLRQWGLIDFIRNDSRIEYENDVYSLSGLGRLGSTKTYLYGNEVPNNKTASFFINIIEKAKEFSELFDSIEEFKENSNLGVFTEMPFSFYQNQVSKVMDNPFYLPTERGLQSIFSLGKNSIQNISDSLFNQFARLDQIARLFKNETSIEPLNISYKNVDGKGFIKKDNDENFYSLYNAASGYQSTIPVVLLIKYYAEFKKKKKTFIIEEPELNLFPKAQKKLIEFFVESLNQFGHSFLLPTHSPYTLTSLENLMYAFKLGNLKNGIYKEEVSKIVEEKYWLNPEEVSVYYLNGEEAIDILDKNEALINKDYIDSVSEITNKEFDSLLAIEVQFENSENDL